MGTWQTLLKPSRYVAQSPNRKQLDTQFYLVAYLPRRSNVFFHSNSRLRPALLGANWSSGELIKSIIVYRKDGCFSFSQCLF